LFRLAIARNEGEGQEGEGREETGREGRARREGREGKEEDPMTLATDLRLWGRGGEEEGGREGKWRGGEERGTLLLFYNSITESAELGLLIK
jgi:hypothetical protein